MSGFVYPELLEVLLLSRRFSAKTITIFLGAFDFQVLARIGLVKFSAVIDIGLDHLTFDTQFFKAQMNFL